MTPEQIKALAKQAGGTYGTDKFRLIPTVYFYESELVEFVRLVRESDRAVMQQAREALENMPNQRTGQTRHAS